MTYSMIETNNTTVSRTGSRETIASKHFCTAPCVTLSLQVGEEHYFLGGRQYRTRTGGRKPSSCIGGRDFATRGG